MHLGVPSCELAVTLHVMKGHSCFITKHNKCEHCRADHAHTKVVLFRKLRHCVDDITDYAVVDGAWWVVIVSDDKQ